MGGCAGPVVARASAHVNFCERSFERVTVGMWWQATELVPLPPGCGFAFACLLRELRLLAMVCNLCGHCFTGQATNGPRHSSGGCSWLPLLLMTTWIWLLLSVRLSVCTCVCMYACVCHNVCVLPLALQQQLCNESFHAQVASGAVPSCVPGAV